MVSSDRERKKELLCGGMEKCMSEVIVVTSGKGGVGKTTTSANVGTGLAKLGKSVVMIDTDTGLRNLDVVLGLENRINNNKIENENIINYEEVDDKLLKLREKSLKYLKNAIDWN